MTAVQRGWLLTDCAAKAGVDAPSQNVGRFVASASRVPDCCESGWTGRSTSHGSPRKPPCVGLRASPCAPVAEARAANRSKLVGVCSNPNQPKPDHHSDVSPFTNAACVVPGAANALGCERAAARRRMQRHVPQICGHHFRLVGPTQCLERAACVIPPPLPFTSTCPRHEQVRPREGRLRKPRTRCTSSPEAAPRCAHGRWADRRARTTATSLATPRRC